MARSLKAKSPTVVAARKPKVIVFGVPSVGKTWAAIEFPNVYYMAVEDGASQPQYVKKLLAAGGLYFGKDEGSQDFSTVIDEVKTLATTEHDRLTLVIDSFSKLYNLAAASAEARVGSDFGKDKKEAQKPTKQLMLWLERLDMNVVLICHRKDEWKREGGQLVNLGGTFDGFDKMEYDLDLVIEVQKQQRYPSLAVVRKSRMEGFPSFSTFPWTFHEFASRAGEATMLKKAVVFKPASAPQVAEVKRLVALLKLDGTEWVDRCFTKAGVTGWDEMDEEKIAKVIDKLNSDIKGQTDGKE